MLKAILLICGFAACLSLHSQNLLADYDDGVQYTYEYKKLETASCMEGGQRTYNLYKYRLISVVSNRSGYTIRVYGSIQAPVDLRTLNTALSCDVPSRATAGTKMLDDHVLKPGQTLQTIEEVWVTWVEMPKPIWKFRYEKLDGKERKATVNADPKAGKSLVSLVLPKFKNSVLGLMNAGPEIETISADLPAAYMTGMNEKQKTIIRSLAKDLYRYKNSMDMSYQLLGELVDPAARIRILVDKSDQFYRDYVFVRVSDIFRSDNYNWYYTGALIAKATAAYDLYLLAATDPAASKTAKNNFLNYGLASLDLVYDGHALRGYMDKKLIAEKEDLVKKLKAAIR